MLVHQLVRLFASLWHLISRLDIPLKMPFEPSLDFRLHRPSSIEHNHSIRLDEGSDVEHRDEDAFPAGQDQRDQIGGQRVEFAQIARLAYVS